LQSLGETHSDCAKIENIGADLETAITSSSNNKDLSSHGCDATSELVRHVAVSKAETRPRVVEANVVLTLVKVVLGEDGYSDRVLLLFEGREGSHHLLFLIWE
jgi:hypothetical protein